MLQTLKQQQRHYGMMRLLLALLALLGCVMAAVHQTRLTKIESQRTKMMRKGTWSHYLKMKNARRIALENRKGSFASVVSQPVS
ncbi:A1 Propeptide [Oesophagostomum dentatum]|uniref:A1 Propeptide n=1 Tax=Oesophagostomum dentatum TaxID=61180 RepID=A0A0B1SGP0_OESDE|nr:A1 Propeptide [Oesophagostomum dentatum]